MELYNLRGKVTEIFELNQFSEKFRKREFVVEVNDGQYYDYIIMQTVQQNCDLLEGVNKGDIVAVRWRLMGRKWKKDGKFKYFTNVECTELNVVSSAGGTGSENTIEDRLPLDFPDELLEPPKNTIFNLDGQDVIPDDDDLPF